MPELIGLVTVNTLNLRSEPSTRKRPIARLARGTRLEISKILEIWYEVDTPKGRGFVHGDFVSIQDPSPTDGFLNEREDLRALALEPAAGEQVEAPAEASFHERALARTWNRYGGMLGSLSQMLDFEAAAAVAVLYTESSGSGFASDGRMIIRFENHVFWRRWGKQNPDTFHRHFSFDDKKSWKGHRFRAQGDGTWAAFHGKQSREWQVLEFARGLDEPAALSSISMGAPQIMGFNHALIGYETVLEMFDQLRGDVRFHILGLFDFIKGPGCCSPMIDALRRRSFEDFAARYNGPGQADVYGHRIAEYREAFLAIQG